MKRVLLRDSIFLREEGETLQHLLHRENSMLLRAPVNEEALNKVNEGTVFTNASWLHCAKIEDTVPYTFLLPHTIGHC